MKKEEEKNSIEVKIEQSRIYNKRPAPKGSIYFIARCKHKGTLHTTAFLAKSAILFKDDEEELKKHLTDVIREKAIQHEIMQRRKDDATVFVLPKVVKYIKRQWKKIRSN